MKFLLSHISDDKTLFDFTGNKEDFDIPELIDNVHVNVSIYRSGDNITCNGTIRTSLSLICDRCLAAYHYPFHDSFEVIYTSEENVEKDEHIMFLSPQDIEIDLKPYIRETIILNIPFKKLCSDDCKGLCAGCGADLNKNACTCTKESTDPRWEKLKELKKSLEIAEE